MGTRTPLRLETVRPGGVRPRRRALAMLAALGLYACLASPPCARAAPAGRGADAERPPSIQALLAASARQGRPVVLMFSQAGCPYCAAIRRDQFVHLQRDAGRRGVIVAEVDIADERPFAPTTSAEAHRSPAALARALGVKLAPTVVFLGPGGELAERLVGYASPDFYGAYLDQRIDHARSALAGAPPAAR
jgi:thiol-disulfide isomerase/thioredoxin